MDVSITSATPTRKGNEQLRERKTKQKASL